MKIGLFTDFYLPSYGGIQTSVINLAQGLKAVGHDVTIVTMAYPGAAEGTPGVIRIPSARIKIDQHYFPLVSQRTLKDMKKNKFDIIHTHTEGRIGRLGGRLAREESVPWIHSAHTILPWYFNGNIFSQAAAAYMAFVIGKTLPGDWDRVQSFSSADVEVKNYKNIEKVFWKFLADFMVNPTVVISPSQHFADKLQSIGVDRIKVVPNSVHCDKFIPRNLEVSSPPHILWVGRMDQEKSPLDFVEGLLELSKHSDNWRATMIGDGPLRQKVEQLSKPLLLAGKLTLTGWVANKEINEYYQRADVFVMTSQQFDNQPMVLLEALASGLCIVYGDKRLKEGLIGPHAKLDVTYYDGILHFIQSKDLLSKKQAAIETAKNFDIEPITQRVVSVYNHAKQQNKLYFKQ